MLCNHIVLRVVALRLHPCTGRSSCCRRRSLDPLWSDDRGSCYARLSCLVRLAHNLDVISSILTHKTHSVGASVTLAESRTKLYRSLRDESQFMHQIKTDTLFNFETVKTTTSESFEKRRLKEALKRYQRNYWKVYSAWNSLSLLQNGISVSRSCLSAPISADRKSARSDRRSVYWFARSFSLIES